MRCFVLVLTIALAGLLLAAPASAGETLKVDAGIDAILSTFEGPARLTARWLRYGTDLPGDQGSGAPGDPFWRIRPGDPPVPSSDGLASAASPVAIGAAGGARGGPALGGALLAGGGLGTEPGSATERLKERVREARRALDG